MSELSVSLTTTPATTKKTRSFPSLLLSDFYLFCSFVLSHPLYFSYFIFFSPYLLKLLSFLSPLFITTFLLLLALLTFSSPGFVHHDNDLSENKVGFVLGTYQAVLNRLRCRAEDGSGAEEFRQYEELEVYKIVFDTLKHEDFGENPVEVLKLEVKESYSTAPEAQVQNRLSGEGFGIAVSEVKNGSSDGNTAVVTRPDGTELIAEEKSIAGFLHQKKEFDELPCRKREKEVKPLSVKSSKVEEEKEVQSFTRSGSKAMGHQIGEAKVIGYDGEDHTPEVNSPRSLEANSWGPDHGGDQQYNSQTSCPNLRGFGSMRREKEWRRTLACKLFEERHNVSDNNGGEGMDLLWETYETDSIKVQGKSKINKGKKGVGIDHHHHHHHHHHHQYSHDVDEDQEEDEEEEENDNGQLCCLQALKFSAGKMNLGMGRPNLAKITKALKGIGWLHNVSKHGKKVYR